MEFISRSGDLALRTQVDALLEPLQVALSRMRVGLFLLDQSFHRLGQQTRDGCPAPDGK